MVEQLQYHRLGEPAQPDCYQVWLLVFSLFCFSAKFRQIWPELLEECETIDARAHYLATPAVTSIDDLRCTSLKIKLVSSNPVPSSGQKRVVE
ncbi:Hypothetical protein NGAL_HAMBI1145_60050 [Neorhizobium galegae bv. officinalis]|uniref:Uncharacterized protein n=1 Tax=Neorhizobium galegae bv. officinalis TaxID=323656 RepID=A0A0T7G308_NEOGA|nr:Hypothetical protein NGAL_HAMBI1145_60050 [Neorhizobium galegae bv. officinalis]